MLTDAALAHQALEYRRLKAQASDLDAKARLASDAVVAEMRRRKLAEPFVYRGLTVTVVAARRTSYRADALRALVSRAIFGRVAKTVVDNAAIKAEIKAGRLSEDDIAPAADVVETAPRIVVSGDVAA